MNSGHRVWRISGGALVNRHTSWPTSGGGYCCCPLGRCFRFWCFCDCSWCWSLCHFSWRSWWWRKCGFSFCISGGHWRFDYYVRFPSQYLCLGRRLSCCRRYDRSGWLLVDYKLCKTEKARKDTLLKTKMKVLVDTVSMKSDKKSRAMGEKKQNQLI